MNEASPIESPLLPAALRERFEVVRVLRHDEHVLVLCVRDTAAARPTLVTLKILAGEAADSLATEFALLAGIAHPNLTRVLEFGRAGSTCWLLREFVEGETLATAGPRLAPPERRTVLADLLRGLAHLHGLGLLHLDVKPENVLLRRTPTRVEAVLTDFGFAAAAARAAGTTTRGTPPFIAPEVLLGLERDARADLFALGVTWLAACPARPDVSPAKLYERFPTRSFVEALGLDLARIDAEFAALLERLLAHDPRDRPPSAAALLAELHDVAIDPRALAPLLRPQPPCVRGAALTAVEELARGDAPGGVAWLVAAARADADAALERVRFAAARAGVPCVELRADADGGDASQDVATPRSSRVLALAREGVAAARGGVLYARMDDAADIDAALTAARLVAEQRTCAFVVLAAAAAIDATRAQSIADEFGVAIQLETLDAAALADHLARLEGVPLEGPAQDRLGRLARALLEAVGPDADAIDLLLRDALDHDRVRVVASRFDFSALATAMWRAPDASSRLRSLSTAARSALALLHLQGGELDARGSAALLHDAERAGLAELVARQLVRITRDETLTLAAPAVAVAALTALDADHVATLAARVLDRPDTALSAAATIRALAFARRERELAEFFERDRALILGSAPAAILAACADARPLVATDFALDRLSDCEADAAARSGALDLARERLAALIERTTDPLQRIERLRRAGSVDILLGRAEAAQARFESAIATAKKPGVKLDVDARAELERSNAYAQFLRGDVGGAHRLLETTLRERHGLKPVTRGRVLALLGSLALRAGRSGRAREALDEALALATTAQDDELVATVESNRATLFLREGQLAQAETALLAARRLRARLGQSWEEAAVANNLGLVLRDLGRLEDARAALDEALRLRRAMGDAAGVAGTLSNLGFVLTLLGTMKDGIDALARAETSFERMRSAPEAALCRVRRAVAHMHLGDHDAAATLLRAIDVGDAAPRVRADVSLTRAEFALAREADDEAGALLAAADKDLAAAGDASLHARAKLVRATLLRRAGDARGARTLLRRLGESLPRLGPSALIEEARATAAEGAHEEAAGLLIEARDEARRMGLARERAVAIAELALLLASIAPARAAAAAGELRPALRQIVLPPPESTSDPLERWRMVLGKALAKALDMEHESTSPSSLSLGRVTTEGISDEVFRMFVAINRSVLRETDRTRLLERLVEHAVALTGARRGYLVLLRDGQVAFESRAGDIAVGHDEVSRSIVLDAIKQRRPLVTANARADARLQGRQSIEDFDLRSVLCVPFQTEGAVEGAIYVDNPVREGLFSTRSIDLLEALAGQAAIAIGNLEHRAQIESMNSHLEERVRVREQELQDARRALGGKPATESGMIAESESMKQVLRLADRVAVSDLPILIRGDSGTGKEVLAHRVHRSSPRAGKPFVAENCSAVPETLLESEFFGYAKGAFTGADRDHDGLFVQADGGTLFLDEIGDMPPSLQSKLLRALQEKAVRPLGSTRSLSVDVRLVCATNRNLEEMVKTGAFREDLYYRIRGAVLTLAPLRERREDVPPLARLVLGRLNAKHETNKTLAPGLVRRLVQHDWPGNVRELESEITRLFHLSNGDVIDESDFDPTPRVAAQEGRAVVAVKPIDEIEKEAIELALRETGGNREEAARRLCISRAAFYVKLKKYGLSDSSPPSRRRKPS